MRGQAGSSAAQHLQLSAAPAVLWQCHTVFRDTSAIAHPLLSDVMSSVRQQTSLHMTWRNLFITCRVEHHNKTLAIKAATGAVRPASAITGLGEKSSWQAQEQQQYSKHAAGSQQQRLLSRRPHSAGPGPSSRGPRDIFPVDLQLVSGVHLPCPATQAFA
jgi:hypothetical protein